MRRKQDKTDAERISRKTMRPFWETLVRKYFDRQSEMDDRRQVGEPFFDKSEVYSKVLRTIAEKQARTRRLVSVFRVAASVILVLGVASAVYLKKNGLIRIFNSERLVQRTTAKGQMLVVNLEDGSRVWLNSDSKLTYPEHFDAEEREISLKGEAYFEVVHASEKPFIIHSGDVKTVVLGTSFNIKAYPDNRKVEVTVLSGKVAVITPGRKKAVLNTVYVTPNQKVAYSSSEILLKPYTVKAEESVGWKEGKMIFKGTPIIEAITELERKYNIKLECSDNITKCKITADFQNESLDKVLKVMAKMIDGTLSVRNGKYYLDGNGCD